MCNNRLIKTPENKGMSLTYFTHNNKDKTSLHSNKNNNFT